jgi:hypothetical protein
VVDSRAANLHVGFEKVHVPMGMDGEPWTTIEIPI